MTTFQTARPMRALRVRMLPATTYQGERVRIYDDRGLIERPLTVPYDYDYDTALAVAAAVLQRHGWQIEAYASGGWSSTGTGDQLLLVTDFQRDSWTNA
jgi:hypothetical protein